LRIRVNFLISPPLFRCEKACEQRRVMAWTTAKRHRTIVLLALVATAWVFSYPLNAGELEASLPNLDLILV
jgi:hypothetical protein